MLILVMALGSAIKEIWISEDYTHWVQAVGKQKLCASNTRMTHRWGGCWHLDAPPSMPFLITSILQEANLLISAPNVPWGTPDLQIHKRRQQLDIEHGAVLGTELLKM